MIKPKQSSRRGNALILAASLLVLLVIVAATFVSRTQTARRRPQLRSRGIQQTNPQLT